MKASALYSQENYRKIVSMKDKDHKNWKKYSSTTLKEIHEANVLRIQNFFNFRKINMRHFP